MALKTKLNLDINYKFFDCKKIVQIEKNLSKIIKEYGVPDIFVNCSYPKDKYWSKNSFKKINLNSFRLNVDNQMNTSAWMIKLIANLMVKKNKPGTIIQLGSIYGIVGQDINIYKNTNMAENMTYSIIKGGILSLTRQMASYYGKFNIRINSVCPGGVFNEKYPQNKIFIKNYRNRVPLKRLAENKEIASSIIFLSSEASSYITGTALMVDGGWTCI